MTTGPGRETAGPLAVARAERVRQNQNASNAQHTPPRLPDADTSDIPTASAGWVQRERTKEGPFEDTLVKQELALTRKIAAEALAKSALADAKAAHVRAQATHTESSAADAPEDTTAAARLVLEETHVAEITELHTAWTKRLASAKLTAEEAARATMSVEDQVRKHNDTAAAAAHATVDEATRRLTVVLADQTRLSEARSKQRQRVADKLVATAHAAHTSAVTELAATHKTALTAFDDRAATTRQGAATANTAHRHNLHELANDIAHASYRATVTELKTANFRALMAGMKRAHDTLVAELLNNVQRRNSTASTVVADK
jgi:hypothetical protein